MSYESALTAMRDTLADLRSQRIGIADFCAAWRARGDVLGALPPRYTEVMEDLLGRMEAGSLFTEESCSFSQADLQDALGTWLARAALKLGVQA